MGLLVSATLYPVVSPSKRHKAIVWGFRIAAVPVAVVLMVVLIRNFYTGDPYAGLSESLILLCVTLMRLLRQHAQAADTFRASLRPRTTIAKGTFCYLKNIDSYTLCRNGITITQAGGSSL